METTHPTNPVNIEYINHGKIFSEEDWYTFHCGNCGWHIFGYEKECKHCGAIMQDKKPSTAGSVK